MDRVSRAALRQKLKFEDLPSVSARPASYHVISMDDRLFVAESGPGNRERFATLFMEVWQRIPSDARAALEAFWRVPYPTYPWTPEIELTDDSDTAGAYTKIGRAFLFNSRIVDQMPDDRLKELIAHELGHAYHHTRKESFYNKDDATEKEVEDEADAIAHEWGFDVKELRRWSDENKHKFEAVTGKAIKTFFH